MKRFLMFLIIAIAVVSLGLTIYYFSTDNEVIYIKSSYLVVQKGDYIQAEGENGLLEFRNKSEYTTLSYGLQQTENEDESKNVLAYKDGYYLAMNGGESKIVIKTNNINYSRLVIDVLVCDGSENFPYIIKTEEDLKKIGNDETYTSELSYKLGNDIELTEEWTPITNFSGTFDGNYFTIKNMNITDDSSAETNVGFISILQSKGKIKNLFLTDINIDVSEEYVGSFAGTNYGTIQTSEATGIIKNSLSEVSYVGGISGRNLYNNQKAKIDRCGFDGTITLTGINQTAGGITGQNIGGAISESYFRGTVNNGSDINFGGLAGENKGVSSATADICDSYFYLKEIGETTNLNLISGIAYDNTNYSSKSKNMVTGCYYGGEFSSTSISKVKINDDPVSQANGYLTKEEFRTNKQKFVTTYSNPVRYWNFDSVWDIPSSSSYPILNVYSSVGSTYLIDISDILTGTDITTAEQLYDVLYNNKKDEVYKISANINCDPNNGGFVWGSADYPLPPVFDGTIINSTESEGGPYTISGLTIENRTPNGAVGMVKNLSSSAIFKGLIINGVTINGVNASHVGVLAGVSIGANILDITITDVDVNISGTAFGTLFGFADKYESHGIKDVTAKFVDGTDAYYYYAGGLVGINLTDITATTEIYNYAYDVNLVANFVGGVTGANGGTIFYTTVNSMDFNKVQDHNSINNLYNGDFDIYVGGIAGINQYKSGTYGLLKGSISNVYANIDIKAQSGTDYKMFIGGITGYNSNIITKAYVTDSSVVIIDSKNSFVGGITGYNVGKISNSVVDKNSSIVTGIASSVGTSQQNGKYLLNMDHCSIVGGIAGFDALTSNATFSIYQCASYMKEIKGYYAGGLVGISYGLIERSFCGESTVSNGNVKITGFFSGGLVSVVAGGLVKNCYTFSRVNSIQTSGTYKDITSVVNMDISACAGLTVFVLGKSVIQNCYAVTTFGGQGVSYATTAKLEGYYSHGTMKNCAYQNTGSKTSEKGATRVVASKLKGSDNFDAFGKALGSVAYWHTEVGKYPTIEGVNVNFPSSSLPYFH